MTPAFLRRCGLQANKERLRAFGNDQTSTSDDRLKLIALYDEAITYLSFLLTIYELFGIRMGESVWETCRRNGAFNRLAQVRQLMSVNRATTAMMLDDIRQELKLIAIKMDLANIDRTNESQGDDITSSPSQSGASISAK